METYAQSWRQIYFNDLYWQDLIQRTISETEATKSAAQKTSILKMGTEIVIAFVVLISFAFLLNWFDQKIAYHHHKHEDVPAYIQHSDQEFIHEFFVNGYLGQTSSNLGLR